MAVWQIRLCEVRRQIVPDTMSSCNEGSIAEVCSRPTDEKRTPNALVYEYRHTSSFRPASVVVRSNEAPSWTAAAAADRAVSRPRWAIDTPAVRVRPAPRTPTPRCFPREFRSVRVPPPPDNLLDDARSNLSAADFPRESLPSRDDCSLERHVMTIERRI